MRAWLGGGFLLLSLVGAWGCGGGGKDGGGTPTERYARPKVSITWGPRSKAVEAPSSALSAVILFEDASHTGADVSFAVDRSGPLEGSTVEYTGTEEIEVTATPMTVRFFSLAGGGGELVGVASATVPVAQDGTVTTTVATEGTVKTVEVPGDQTLVVGEKRALNFGVKDEAGDLVAVTPGSATWTVVTGGDKLTFEGNEATGVAVGTATVTATVDGKTSEAATVSVVDPGAITVSISPTAVSLPPGGTQRFTAEVEGTSDKRVTWTVVGQNDGVISTAGLYTAPEAVGTYTVRATSVANPQKSASATVSVENVTVEITPATATVDTGATQQFTVAVSGTANQGVTWSVVEAGGGTVSETGLYTAPSAAGTFTVRATSQVNPSVFAQAVVTVQAPPAVMFRTIGRFGAAEGEIPALQSVNAFSSNGSTVVGALLVGGKPRAAYWTEASGWVEVIESGVDRSSIVTVDATGTYMAGNGFNSSTDVRAYRWHRNGQFIRLPAPDGSMTGLGVAAMSDNGQTIVGRLGGEIRPIIRWTEAGGSTVFTSSYPDFFLECLSGDGQTIAGWDMTFAGCVWRLGEPQPQGVSGDSVRYLSYTGNEALGRFFYWSRATGRQDLESQGIYGHSMSRSGKYIVYLKDGEPYVWNVESGAKRPLRPLFEAAGAPAGLNYDDNNQHHRIADDGKTITGFYSKAPGASQPYYAYYCHLSEAP